MGTVGVVPMTFTPPDPILAKARVVYKIPKRIVTLQCPKCSLTVNICGPGAMHPGQSDERLKALIDYIRFDCKYDGLVEHFGQKVA